MIVRFSPVPTLVQIMVNAQRMTIHAVATVLMKDWIVLQSNVPKVALVMGFAMGKLEIALVRKVGSVSTVDVIHVLPTVQAMESVTIQRGFASVTIGGNKRIATQEFA